MGATVFCSLAEHLHGKTSLHQYHQETVPNQAYKRNAASRTPEVRIWEYSCVQLSHLSAGSFAKIPCNTLFPAATCVYCSYQWDLNQNLEKTSTHWLSSRSRPIKMNLAGLVRWRSGTPFLSIDSSSSASLVSTSAWVRTGIDRLVMVMNQLDTECSYIHGGPKMD